MCTYVLLGVIPLGLLVTYINVFIGLPKLAEIPEGYEQEHWEYFDHPIKQFFAKWFMKKPEMNYEKKMNILQEEYEKVQLREIQRKVKKLMRGSVAISRRRIMCRTTATTLRGTRSKMKSRTSTARRFSCQDFLS
ncbi:hypothetical protein HPB49_005163 [Dermacentor silvarum]|uniref:Uncharacterized protein n=1 Tax=Dermacentor silvarum TaxID=543639 RepID=A0ACB8CVB1_DERSI|nr:hypothetical protein HPB49_005163 [Dermacentor silvarum]